MNNIFFHDACQKVQAYPRILLVAIIQPRSQGTAGQKISKQARGPGNEVGCNAINNLNSNLSISFNSK